jgi:hypothetical protein
MAAPKEGSRLASPGVEIRTVPIYSPLWTFFYFALHQKRSLTLVPLGLSLEMSPFATAKLRRTTLTQRLSNSPDLRGHSGS